jgi:hypothetical protein
LLRPNTTPGALGDEERDEPFPDYFPAGQESVKHPGGSYTALAGNPDGRQVANWLESLGIVALLIPRYQTRANGAMHGAPFA